MQYDTKNSQILWQICAKSSVNCLQYEQRVHLSFKVRKYCLINLGLLLSTSQVQIIGIPRQKHAN